MDSVLEFLNQPIVVTLLTLVVGSYAISLIAERRSRKIKLRDTAIEFITEAGNSMNQFMPHIYAQLRTGTIEWNQALDDGLKELLSKRMGIQVGSQAYLKSETFHVQYFQLLDEIMGVVQCFREIELGGDSEEVIQKIRENRNRLNGSWPLADEAIPSSAKGSAGELVLWLDMIIHRMTSLLVTNLNSIMSNRW
jgi:hypothetical protein